VIAKRLSGAEIKEQLLRQIKQSIGDKSWRVRYMAANHFNEVCLQGVEGLDCSNLSTSFLKLWVWRSYGRSLLDSTFNY
jgi:hypothetical protein